MRRPRTTLALLAVFLAGMLAVPSASGQGMGISAGPNFNELGDVRTSEGRITLDRVIGWHGHLWLDLPLGPIALRPGVRYMDVGRLFESAEADGIQGAVEDDQAITFLEFPLDVRLRMRLPLITPYVVGGPVLRFATDANNRDQLKRLSLAAGAGVGFRVAMGGVEIYPEVKYTFGITRFTESEYQLGDVVVEPDEDQKLNAVMISLGIGL